MDAWELALLLLPPVVYGISTAIYAVLLGGHWAAVHRFLYSLPSGL